MELLEILYIAMGTIGILIVLHIGTFWVSRIMQPPKPKIVYVQAPQSMQPAPPHPVAVPHIQPPPPPPVLSQAPQTIQLPTYEIAPSINPENTSTKSPVGALPPPIETRNTSKQSGGDLGAPR